ncbi:UDP-N-acetylmuramoyl-tripeptide--D-alanyl-D-alanine ligase [Candidatus Dojkabacteria bacterium]|uniref:UDP-N-acetylmuramoyl-tripeptide--D-alanyl-D-alanine ligase n=1 Tax=Candidatus Dojkabacteria bacterium TaxID=2099670 RepID=A0A955RHH8_9BACT|nr:UDP-N-acetylmuramoyl-tripeptide--D-alanyl-D-alanine ligase [Candidatus Dojkabacteria bacterium]
MNLKNFVSKLILNYLRIISKLQLKKVNPLIIGITGSAGKTSLMYAIGAVLSSKYKVKLSEKANSESGIPANILNLKFDDYSAFNWLRVCILAPVKLLTDWEKHDIYVAEMGIDSPDEPKNMSYLLKIVKPNIAVFLNVSATHSERFDKLVDENITGEQRLTEVVNEIADEKGKIITELGKDGIGIVFADEEPVYRQSLRTEAKVMTFGSKNNPDLEFTDYEVSELGTRFKFHYNQNDYEFKKSSLILPKHYGDTFAAALLVGIACKIPIEDGLENLERTFSLPLGRSTIIKGKKGSTIIDSSYNASYEPTKDMVNLTSMIEAKRRIFVFGDMRELGNEERLLHEKIAKEASSVFNLFVTVGPLTKKYFAPKLAELGVQKNNIKTFDKAGDAGKYLSETVEEGDLILVKGSQNTIFLEIVIEELMVDKAKAEKILCRRGEFWEKKRTEYV